MLFIISKLLILLIGSINKFNVYNILKMLIIQNFYHIKNSLENKLVYHAFFIILHLH